jgi:hypothetical protein
VSLLLRMPLLQSSMSDTRRIEAEKVFFVRIKVGCSRIQINWSVHPRYGNRRQQRKSQPASQPELLPSALLLLPPVYNYDERQGFQNLATDQHESVIDSHIMQREREREKGT